MRVRNLALTAVSLFVLSAVVVICYRAILLPASDSLYPWASDTLGHVLKAEYMQQQLRAGFWYPDLFPNWYLGLQMLRYHPPLPYYLLVGLIPLTGDAVTAANWFIALCALLGGLGWLPYKRWLGWAPALIGGALYTFLPDNIRVAFAEGNLPRVLASALVPWAVYFMLRSLEATGRRWHRFALSLCFAAFVLSHAMMAAIYAACCALLCIALWIGRSATTRTAVSTIGAIFLGLILAGWWLLPSLVGGITELNPAAMTEALAVFPLAVYLNPLLRAGDPEIVYPGAVLFLATAVLLFFRRGRNAHVVALTAIGLFGILITSTGFNALFNSLPLHHLFWPLRFIGFASFCLLLALAWRFREWKGRAMILPLLLAGLLAGDGALSLRLIHLRPARAEVVETAARLASQPGWREATLDYSRLGSAPSYFFTAVGQREQLYGWAYQGARTALNVSAIDEALQQDFPDYAVDRLNLFGVDDIVQLDTQPMAAALPQKLTQAGFTPLQRGIELTHYHRDGAPRAYRANWRALGIGRGAQNLAYIFPQIILGTSPRLDDYTFEELTRYEALVLAGFDWNDRQRAEELTRQAALAGVRILVDLTGAPYDPLARQPRFLDVWGETIYLGSDPLSIIGTDGQSFRLRPFSSQFSSWKAYSPQGLDYETLRHPYFGMWGAVLGYRQVETARIWFIGLNLPYHAVLTHDPAAIALLSDVLGLPANQTNAYQAIPLADYAASPAGYRFRYTLDQPDTLLVPIAHHDGMRVTIDGRPAPVRSFERLLAFNAPAGSHDVSVTISPPPIYLLGLGTTAIASLVLIAGAAGLRLPALRRAPGEKDHEHASETGMA